MKNFLILLITLYQKTVSPNHSPLAAFFGFNGCKYYPSCSEYTKRAISRYPLAKAAYLSVKRLLRCNPWSNGGIDEA